MYQRYCKDQSSSDSISVMNIFTGKSILVTGGTGSFGKMFVKEVLQYDPAEIVIFSRDENKQGQMRQEYQNDKRLRFVLGDVRDYKSLREAMRNINYVFNAAALKWVPAVEYNVYEGVKTNILGVQNVIEAARDENVEKVVQLSTDKAVEPINAMGMQKALGERLITTANLYRDQDGVKTIFVSTRYGNVLGSRGSVIPLFRSLIDSGKPITVTSYEMTRFILTLQESVKLVIKALEEGVGGEIFVQKMPAHTVKDLVDVMLETAPAGHEVKEIGIRPGEKIHESLISAVEAIRTVDIGDYYAILPQIIIPAVEEKYKDFKKGDLSEYASNTVNRLTKDELRDLLDREGWLKSQPS